VTVVFELCVQIILLTYIRFELPVAFLFITKFELSVTVQFQIAGRCMSDLCVATGLVTSTFDIMFDIYLLA